MNSECALLGPPVALRCREHNTRIRLGDGGPVRPAVQIHMRRGCAHQGSSEGFLIDASGFSSNRFICLRSVTRLSNITDIFSPGRKHGRGNKAKSIVNVGARKGKGAQGQSWQGGRTNSPSVCCPKPFSTASTVLLLRPHPPVHAALVSYNQTPGEPFEFFQPHVFWAHLLSLSILQGSLE